MGMARSTFYDEPIRAADDTAIAAMAAICDDFEHYGWRRVQAALNPECGAASRQRPIATTTSRSFPTLPKPWRLTAPTNFGSPISPTSPSSVASFMSLSFWMPSLGGSWVMPSAAPSTRDWRSPPCPSRLRRDSRRLAVSITPIAGPNTLPRSTATTLLSTASRDPWGGEEIRTTTQRRKLHEDAKD
jgi:hypothetical protein